MWEGLQGRFNDLWGQWDSIYEIIVLESPSNARVGAQVLADRAYFSLGHWSLVPSSGRNFRVRARGSSVFSFCLLQVPLGH